MKNKNMLGGILAVVAALMGIFGHIYLFLAWYRIGMSAEFGGAGMRDLVEIYPPGAFGPGHFGRGDLRRERLWLLHP